jgi:DNA-3-methyladenine glycosylase
VLSDPIEVVVAMPPEEAAPRMLGWIIGHRSDEGLVRVRLTEVEAYAGERDPASHAYRGQTSRNAVMFGEPGRLYVYRSYGLHWAANIVTGDAGVAGGVLLRAGEVIDGFELAMQRRGAPRHERMLARGPGNLAQALGLTGADYGTNLLGSRHLWLEAGTGSGETTQGPRVGVASNWEAPWRFWILGHPTVSAYRRSSRAKP